MVSPGAACTTARAPVSSTCASTTACATSTSSTCLTRQAMHGPIRSSVCRRRPRRSSHPGRPHSRPPSCLRHSPRSSRRPGPCSGRVPPRSCSGRVSDSAGYYNVQLYRGSRKILSAWPKRAQYRLKARWTYRGERRRLGPGRYRWMVWPGYGKRSKANFGKRIVSSTFQVKRAGASRDLVDRLAGLEHGDELREPPCPRLRPLGVVEPVEDRVAVLAVERLEERLGGGPCFELALGGRREPSPCAGRRRRRPSGRRPWRGRPRRDRRLASGPRRSAARPSRG